MLCLSVRTASNFDSGHVLTSIIYFAKINGNEAIRHAEMSTASMSLLQRRVQSKDRFSVQWICRKENIEPGGRRHRKRTARFVYPVRRIGSEEIGWIEFAANKGDEEYGACNDRIREDLKLFLDFSACLVCHLRGPICTVYNCLFHVVDAFSNIQPFSAYH